MPAAPAMREEAYSMRPKPRAGVEVVLVEPVQFQQPVLVTLGGGQLFRAHLAGLRIEADDRLGTGATGEVPT